MTSFPGRVYDGAGVPVDGRKTPLTEMVLADYPHRSMVTARGLAPVARVWLLDDDASFAAVPAGVVDVAVKLVESGQAILILARRREAEVDVREGLLAIVPDMDVLPDVAGHA